MKKVTAFIGSSHKRATYQAVQEFETNLKTYGEIDFEYVFLKDYRLEYCNGCCLCFDKGEEYCPLKDDRDILLEKLDGSDGVIFATPSYSFQVTARMKNLLDRLAFTHHRPRFMGKVFMPIVPYGIFGGSSITKYLKTMGENFGFRVAKGCSLMTLGPMTELQQRKISQKIKKASMRFYKEMTSETPPSVSILRLLIFRLSRTSIKLIRDKESRDYLYYKEKGWFEADFFYDVQLGFIKKLAGRFFDFSGRCMFKQR